MNNSEKFLLSVLETQRNMKVQLEREIKPGRKKEHKDNKTQPDESFGSAGPRRLVKRVQGFICH
jgi:hypothetical protein